MTKTILTGILPAALLLLPVPAAAITESKRQPEPAEPFAGPVKAAPSMLRTGLTGDYVSFSEGKGFRRTVTADVTRDFGATTLKLGLSQGERDFGPGKESRSGVQASAMLSHDWSSRITTVTTLSAGSRSPVFGRFHAQQDVDLKLLPGTVFRVGGRYTRFFGGQEVRAANVGATHYFGSGLVSYRLSAFDVAGRGRTTAHLASFQLKDPRGSGTTQLWAGTGSSLHELDWLAEPQDGRSRSLTLRRVQPLGGGVGVSLTVGRTWYDRPLADYRGTRFGVGLTYRR